MVHTWFNAITDIQGWDSNKNGAKSQLFFFYSKFYTVSHTTADTQNMQGWGKKLVKSPLKSK